MSEDDIKSPVDVPADEPSSPVVTENLNAAEKAILGTEANDNEAKTEEKSEESSEEESKEESKEEPEKKELPTKETEKETEEDAPEEKEEPAEETKEDSEPEPADSKEQARKAYQARQQKANTRRQIVEQLNKSYGPATKEQLEEKGYQGVSAEVEALRQQITYKDERDRIADLNADMQAEAGQVIEDFPIFNPGSEKTPNPAYNEEFAKEVQELYKSTAHLKTDKDGIILNADEGIYSFYSKMARMYGYGNKQGEEAGKKNTVKMLSRSEKPPTGTQVTKTDELADVFLEGFNRTT